MGAVVATGIASQCGLLWQMRPQFADPSLTWLAGNNQLSQSVALNERWAPPPFDLRSTSFPLARPSDRRYLIAIERQEHASPSRRQDLDYFSR